jgi:hypothetical protein
VKASGARLTTSVRAKRPDAPRERTGAGRHGDQQEATRHIVDHNDERIDAGRRVKGVGEPHCRHGQPDRHRRGPGPASFTTISPTSVATRCPPTSARGWAGAASGIPMTSTMEVANGMNMRGKGALADSHSISAMAIAPPAAPATTTTDARMAPLLSVLPMILLIMGLLLRQERARPRTIPVVRKLSARVLYSTRLFGGARRSRTADLLNAIQALSQLSYGPVQMTDVG